MEVKIRKVEKEDFEAVYQFICELQKKTFDKIQLQHIFIENIAKKDNIYLVACYQENLVGYISCHIQQLLHHAGKVAEIQEVFVNPEYRSQGIGKKMISRIKTLAKEQGALQLEVTTRQIRERAIQFYIRESFEDSHKKLVYYY